MTSDSSSLQPFVDRLQSHSTLSLEERLAIQSLPVEIRHLRSGQELVRLGETTSHSAMIASGMLAGFDQSREGNRQINSFHVPGECPDLRSLIQPTVTNALLATTATTVLLVSHRDLTQIWHRHSAIAAAFWRETVIDTQIALRWLFSLGRLPAKERLAHLFCEMACRVGARTRGKGFTFRFPVTQTHLGEALGLTSVHINRVSQALRAEGVSLRAGEVRIDDWDHLKRIADFDPTYLQLPVEDATERNRKQA